MLEIALKIPLSNKLPDKGIFNASWSIRKYFYTVSSSFAFLALAFDI